MGVGVETLQRAHREFAQPCRSVEAGGQAREDCCVEGILKVEMLPHCRDKAQGVGAPFHFLGGAGGELVSSPQHGVHLGFLETPGDAVQDVPGLNPM